jgi:hypothetical protein
VFFGIVKPQQNPGSSTLVNPEILLGPSAGRHICPSFSRASIYASHRPIYLVFIGFLAGFPNSVSHPAKFTAELRNRAATKSHPARLGNAHSYELHGLSSENPLSSL